MSDNIATARSLHEEYGRKQCWEEQQEPIVSFCCDDGATCGFPFFHLSVARLTDYLLSLQRPGTVIEIRGPLAGEFYKDFAKHRGLGLKQMASRFYRSRCSRRKSRRRPRFKGGKYCYTVLILQLFGKAETRHEPILARLTNGPLLIWGPREIPCSAGGTILLSGPYICTSAPGNSLRRRS